MIEPLVASVGAAFPVEESLRHLQALAALDRFQSSDGIVKAAELVAEALTQYGLSGVHVHRYTSPAKWWTFEGPVSWTPVHAALSLSGDGEGVIARYPDDPMCLATHSAPTGLGRMRARLSTFDHVRAGTSIAGTVLLVDTRTTDLQEGIAAAERGGAAGVVADPLGRRPPSEQGATARGRIELNGDTRLFGFSLTRGEFSRLERAAGRGAGVEVSVLIHRSAPMPVVEAFIPGRELRSEVVIHAHLCHPRPGANDNCSGVAAALGLAAALVTLPETALGPRRRSIRFVLGPEFVGTAAYVHDFVQTGRRPRPIAAINLDMVGENQALCGGPMTIELPPEHVPSPLGALVEHCLSLLPSEATGYSGATASRTWNATLTPFAGASDHAIYADRVVGIPAVMIGHWPDRFAHTSDDTVDKVDPRELWRAATLAGSCALTLSVAHPAMHEHLSLISVGHTLNRLLAASRLNRREGDAQGVFSPSAPAHRAELLDFLAERGHEQIAALEQITGGPRFHAGEAIDRQKRLLYALLDLGGRRVSCGSPGPVVERLWPGPFNVRGLLDRSAGAHAERVRRRMWADKSTYAVVLALAHAIDDRSSRLDIVRRAALGSALDIDLALADDVLEAIIAAGWARERQR